MTYINETAAPNLNDVMIVLKTNADGKSLQKIESYGDGNAETISRPRGGIIHAYDSRWTNECLFQNIRWKETQSCKHPSEVENSILPG